MKRVGVDRGSRRPDAALAPRGKEGEGGLGRRGWLLLNALYILSQVLQQKVYDSHRGSERLSDSPNATQPAGFVFSNKF